MIKLFKTAVTNYDTLLHYLTYYYMGANYYLMI